jgi:L-ascorbate metabolism protein UlaG (beta-lactamase superfamily)
VQLPAAMAAGRADVLLHFVGHATMYIELDGVRILTDPLLRPMSAGLVHRSPPPAEITDRPVDAVLISHLHHDHLDIGSLRLLPSGFDILVARGGGPLLAQHGFRNARELSAGQSAEVKGVSVIATRADHRGFRVPAGPTGETVGFIIEGTSRIYFAGDTAVFEAMSELRPIDVALLPIAGWGPLLGPGHMDAVEAVNALRLIEPRIAVPIHWGTLAPLGIHFGSWSYLTQPGERFRALAGRELPWIEVDVVQPGESLVIPPVNQADGR